MILMTLKCLRSGGITFFGGVSVLVATMIGPGLITIPLLFQSAGWLTSILMFILAIFLSTTASLVLCEVLSSIPGNEKFQSLDKMFIKFAGKSCGIELYPNLFKAICVNELTSEQNSPFGSNYMLVTFGLLLTFGFVIPMTLSSLSDNAKVQILVFIVNGLNHNNVPLIGKDQSQLVGTILFNYAFIVFIPSLVNELEIQDNDNEKLKKNIFIEITTYLFPIVGLLTAIPVDAIIIKYNLIESGICNNSKYSSRITFSLPSSFTTTSTTTSSNDNNELGLSSKLKETNMNLESSDIGRKKRLKRFKHMSSDAILLDKIPDFVTNNEDNNDEEILNEKSSSPPELQQSPPQSPQSPQLPSIIGKNSSGDNYEELSSSTVFHSLSTTNSSSHEEDEEIINFFSSLTKPFIAFPFLFSSSSYFTTNKKINYNMKRKKYTFYIVLFSLISSVILVGSIIIYNIILLSKS
nr:1979_t:CDS:2 [Entrophospora candida]